MTIHSRFSIPAAAATIALAGFSPAAQARTNDDPVTGNGVPITVAASPQRGEGDGFSWADAGIGAAAAAAAAAALAAGTSSRRRRSGQAMAA